MTGWLVNDCLTCIPNTRTLWHDLLDSVSDLVDKTGGYTPFDDLAEKIENELSIELPDYIIRNASYFRHINTSVPQISLLQDIGAQCQYACDSARVLVANSNYTLKLSPSFKAQTEIIYIGVDLDVFKPTPEDSFSADIVYVGNESIHPKGFYRVLDMIHNTNYTFNLIMKDDFRIDHPRVKVFNKIPSSKVCSIISSSKVLMCTSEVETQHLAGMEAMACNTPVVATQVGIYHDFPDSPWGVVTSDFKESVRYVMQNLEEFKPREFIILNHLDKKSCMNKWNELINKLKEN